jgi:hypothetical protein
MHSCTVCKEPARHVHHLSYDEATLLGHTLEKLHSVCEQHHESAHEGSPELLEGPLRKRFAAVNKDHRREVRLENEFRRMGSELIVKAKLSHGWWKCHFQWKPSSRHKQVADQSDRWFFLGAHDELTLKTRGCRPWQKSGVVFTADGDALPCLSFFWAQMSPATGLIKFRSSKFPDWISTLKALTSRHPFPVFIIADKGECVARSGGFKEAASRIKTTSPVPFMTSLAK